MDMNPPDKFPLKEAIILFFILFASTICAVTGNLIEKDLFSSLSHFGKIIMLLNFIYPLLVILAMITVVIFTDEENYEKVGTRVFYSLICIEAVLILILGHIFNKYYDKKDDIIYNNCVQYNTVKEDKNVVLEPKHSANKEFNGTIINYYDVPYTNKTGIVYVIKCPGCGKYHQKIMLKKAEDK